MQLVPEMTYQETIAGPWGPTTGSPFGPRLCWSVTGATLRGDRIDAHLVMPGADWIRLGSDGVRRQDQRLVFETADAAVVMLSYDNAPTSATHRRLIALTLAEIRRLLNLIHHGEHAITHALHWSIWRRHHQAQARRAHFRRHLHLQTLTI